MTTRFKVGDVVKCIAPPTPDAWSICHVTAMSAVEGDIGCIKSVDDDPDKHISQHYTVIWLRSGTYTAGWLEDELYLAEVCDG